MIDQDKVIVARRLAFSSYLLLVIVIIAWVLSIEDPARRLTPFLLGLLPLLLVLRGMLYARPKTHAVLVFIALLYLIHGSVELFTAFTWFALLETIASLTLMFSAAYYVKWHQQAN
jgi:uncharacterized membrane protein